MPQIATVPAVGVIVGNAFTVTIAVTIHPLGVVYVTVDVPALTGVTTPDEDPIVATPVLPLTQVPPVRLSLSVVVLPIHTFNVPVMPGIG